MVFIAYDSHHLHTVKTVQMPLCSVQKTHLGFFCFVLFFFPSKSTSSYGANMLTHSPAASKMKRLIQLMPLCHGRCGARATRQLA